MNVETERDIYGPHAMRFGWGTKVIFGLLVLIALVGAVAGIATTVTNVNSAQQDTKREDTSQAQTNRSSCLTTVAAANRLVSDIGWVLLTTPKGQPIPKATARHLGLPLQVAQAIPVMNARAVASSLDDLRTKADAQDPICPFVVGDPDHTPDKPVRSETAKLEAKLRRTGHP